MIGTAVKLGTCTQDAKDDRSGIWLTPVLNSAGLPMFGGETIITLLVDAGGGGQWNNSTVIEKMCASICCDTPVMN